MTAFFRRGTGILLAIFSAASLVVTIFLLASTWQASQKLEDQLVTGINHTQQSINIASDGLVATQQVLTDTQNILQATVDLMLSITASIHEVPPVLKSLEELSGKDLPQTIASTQLSLVTAQDSAGRIEEFLALVTQIPFFPGGKYDPEVTLKEALGDVAKDLDGVRQPLKDMEKGIKSTRTNLEGMEVEGGEVALELRKVAKDLKKAGEGLTDSLEQVEALDKLLQTYEEKIPGWLETATWVATFLLVWVGLAQISWLVTAIGSVQDQKSRSRRL